MKIGVIADTHISSFPSKLFDRIYEYFKECDFIVHAGDSVELSVLEELKKIAEIKAVRGNMDSLEIKKQLPEKIVFEASGKTIGVTHGRGAASQVARIAADTFKKKLDIIIFGHSHVPFNKKINGTLFLNPGSATDKIFAPYCSIGIIEINDGIIQSKIVRIDD
ncbi:MAG: metallophosphoesterase family protein [Candidatus Omnitrophota bacterium]|nr:metallophosphatase family protein [Candidatus Omnitrophota bacterium]